MLTPHYPLSTPPTRTRVAGFNLLELLVVVVILVLAAAAVPPLISGAVPRAELQSAAREVAAALRYARSYAVSHRQQTTLHVDVERRRYRISGHQRDYALPQDINISVYGAASASPGRVVGGIRFFPDGSATGGRITLARDGRSYRVDVDWLLGRVKVNG
jgi:general secretion pathway protein H